ncbi:NUDIX hydrolase [Paenibacillus prosopidis]|uniref:ADP-ribose pyrophosphatase YjhB (NUDIX family) n=1 Tax=Paenibacillus prosopidis TaxID=630520 RepID=A0A368VUA5_9BACL|nr:NUDIX hydrolase [Paenibacillus prosopidis]RCW45445.1 ADP-ribose pyrophosphatase YjhB (NUDIX family) [Paenibacillus prosopidis]
MITFEKENNKFNFRVAGIAIHDNRILLHTTLKDDFWNLPGGRVEFNESTDLTILREIKEELDIEVRIEELLFVNEDFFEYDGKKYHEICFYYLITFPLGHEIIRIDDEFYGIEDEGRLIFKWFLIDQLIELNVYPEILRTELLKLKANNQIHHFVNHQ